MPEFELSATFKLWTDVGHGDYTAFVALRESGGTRVVRLRSEAPIGSGAVFQVDGTAWRATKYIDGAELWEAVPVAQ